jgi:prophage DNA circulation protein
MSSMFDLPAIWRQQLMPAAFNGAAFHCEANARESGRRIVQHQFPKKDLPYAEDMGRAAREFTLRGYCIVFPYDGTGTLYRRDYRIARDALITQLERKGLGLLRLPTQRPQRVVCLRYRMQEEEKVGGYCVFDMTFAEAGADPQISTPGEDTSSTIEKSADKVESQVQQTLAPPPQTINT